MKTFRTAALSLIIGSGFGLSVFADMISVSPLNENDPVTLANAFLGDKITVTDVQYSGRLCSAGTYENSTVESQGNPNLFSGAVLSTGKVCYLSSNGINEGNVDSDYNVELKNSMPGDADLNKLVKYGTYDASILEIYFKAEEDVTNTIWYVFGSDEYDRKNFDFTDDIFGIFLDDQNIATIPNTNLPVSVYNLYNSAPSKLVLNNDLKTEMNAFTVPLEATFTAKASTTKTYCLKFVIADGGDNHVDSWVLLGHPAVQVPEPSMMVLLITGIILLAASGFFLRKKFLLN
jgi:hypothetical protein